MSNESILKADVLDILFDSRNKAYGAYMLRKFYPNRIRTSLFIMLGMALAFSAFTLLPEKKVPGTVYDTGEFIIPQYHENPTKEEMKSEERKSKPQKNQAIFTTNIVVKSNTDSTVLLNDLTDMTIGNKNILISDFGTGDPGPPSEGTQHDIEPTKPADAVNVEIKPIDNPDIQATYPGGTDALSLFLQRNLRSPQGLEEGESIQVKVKFVVGFDGVLQGFDVVQDGGHEFNSEVIRVLQKMPRWNPGKKGGRNVPVYYTIPVKFTSSE